MADDSTGSTPEETTPRAEEGVPTDPSGTVRQEGPGSYAMVHPEPLVSAAVPPNDNARAEVGHREHHVMPVWQKAILATFATIIVLMAGVTFVRWSNDLAPKAEVAAKAPKSKEATVTPAANKPTPEEAVINDPSLQVIKGGVRSVGDVLKWLERQKPSRRQEFLEYVRDSHQLRYSDLERMASNERKYKTNYRVKLPAGTVIVNSYRDKSGNIKPTKVTKLKRDRWALQDDNGNIWVLLECGNIAAVKSFPPGHKRPPLPKCGPADKSKVYVAPTARLAGKTRVYKRNNAETVVKKRKEEETVQGPTTYGKKGEGTGSSGGQAAPAPTAPAGPSYGGVNEGDVGLGS